MRQCGLPEGYAAALEAGLWPSGDILPPTELPKRDRRLEPGTVIWQAPTTSGDRANARWPTGPGW
jgi:hypothetical protein